LSGLSQALLHGTAPADAGFGLFSKNVFLQGKIVATSGSIGGINMESSKLYTGTGTHGNANTGFYIDSTSNFSLGKDFVFNGSTQALTLSGSGVTIAAPTFKLDTDKFDVDSTVGTLALGTSPTLTSGVGAFFSSSGEFRLGDNDGNMHFKDGSFYITGSDLNIGITDLNISSSKLTLSSPPVPLSPSNINSLFAPNDIDAAGEDRVNFDDEILRSVIPIFKSLPVI
jgi:hypothetical protein